jgi:hypothetical protein
MGRIIAWVGKSTLRTVGSIFWSKIGGWASKKALKIKGENGVDAKKADLQK